MLNDTRKHPEGIAAGDLWRTIENEKVRHIFILRLFELVPEDWHVEFIWLDTREIEYRPPEAITYRIFKFERVASG